MEFAVGLVHHDTTDDCPLLFQQRMGCDIQGDVSKGGLETHSRRYIEIVNEALNRFFHLLVIQAIIVNERSQIGIYAGYSLRTCRFTLKGKEQVCQLHEGRFEVLRRSGFDLTFGAPESLHQEILQIPTAAIGGEET